MSEVESLPYRPNVGVMLTNQDGLIFVGQRLDQPGSDAWQMPQGGIDEGEDAETAAYRELEEETGVKRDRADIIARSSTEHFYDLPPELAGKLWGGKWRGQRQLWFLMRYRGSDEDIDITTDHAEFSRWQWVKPDELPSLIVPFKRKIYTALVREFEPLI